LSKKSSNRSPAGIKAIVFILSAPSCEQRGHRRGHMRERRGRAGWVESSMTHTALIDNPTPH
jgi:hypothetical protein